MRIMRVVAVAMVAAATQAAAQSKTVDRAVATWAKVKALSGSFEQTLTNPLLRNTATTRGTFAQQQPNRIAIRFTDPKGDAIIADGAHLWIFLQQATPGQVLKRPVTDRLASPIDVGMFLDSPAKKFEITERGADAVGDRHTQMVGLVPKANVDVPFTNATVWIDDADGMIRQFEVTEPSGLIRRIRLTKLVVNPFLKASEFRFVVPKGIRVVER